MRIPAVVLSYDANHAYVAHLVDRYQRLWPDHPFQFVVPYQRVVSSALQNRLACLSHANAVPIEFVVSAPAIKATVLTLLQSCADDQWIYWCIDDKYPLWLDCAFMERLHRAIRDQRLAGVDGICFCRSRQLATGKALMANRCGLWNAVLHPLAGPLFRRKNFAQIWLHQYIRAGVLRSLFQAFPDRIETAKDLDRLKRLIPLPDQHRLFVTSGHYASFGESTTRGMVTRNCAQSMAECGIDIPEAHPRSEREIIIGQRRPHRRPDRLLRAAASIAYAATCDGLRVGP